MTAKRAGTTLKARSSQSRRFIETARQLGCDEDPEAFERVFAQIVRPKQPPDSPAVENAGMRAKRQPIRRKRGVGSKKQALNEASAKGRGTGN